MRVLHIFNEIKFSGAEIMYANAAPLFQQEGFELVAMATGAEIGDFTPNFEKAGIRVVHNPFRRSSWNPLYWFRYFRDIARFIKKNEIDIIHTHRADIYWQFALCSFLTGRRHIMTLHNVYRNRWFTWPKAWLERLTARKFFATSFHSISESVEANEASYYKNPTARINNWYDATRFFPAGDPNEKQAAKQQLNIDPASFVIISIGGCSHVKNHHDILRALKTVAPSFHCTYLHLGCGSTEAEEKTLAAELGVQQQALFLGNKNNVRDHLLAADVFVMTSQFEGLGNAAVEAMACGLPSILYDCAGLRDLIKNDDNGFLIASDPRLLAKKMQVLRDNKALGIAQGERAMRFVREHFSIQKSVAQMIRLYRRESADNNPATQPKIA